jgi:hypothetical protein
MSIADAWWTAAEQVQQYVTTISLWYQNVTRQQMMLEVAGLQYDALNCLPDLYTLLWNLPTQQTHPFREVCTKT